MAEETLEVILNQCAITLPKTQPTPAALFEPIIRVRNTSAILTRYQHRIQARRSEAQGLLLIAQAALDQAYREALTTSSWVKAGLDQNDRKERANKLAEEQFGQDLLLAKQAMHLAAAKLEAIALTQKDLDNARRDLHELVELVKLDVRLQT